MFTGIITDIGKVKSRIGNTLCISTVHEPNVGDSISVNGVCLTVVNPIRKGDALSNGVKKNPGSFCVDLLTETIKKTNLGRLRTGEPVNLELALKVGDRIGGHIVTGHVDCTGKIIRRYKKGNDSVIEIESSARNLRPKDSIAVNGVSLTIVKVMRNRFTVHLIPYTLAHTNLSKCRVVNIELDKYAKILRSPSRTD